MKNSIFLSLALLVTTNTFIVTPAMAYTWSDAKITGKTALGIAALGTSAILPILWRKWGADSSAKGIVQQFTGLSGLAVLTTSIISLYVGGKALKSAWKDFIMRKKSEITNSQISEVTNPLITEFQWGKVTVNFDGRKYEYKDCKLSPKGPQNWDWSECGTNHDRPGIQTKALASIINDCDIIILSRGVDRKLQTPSETMNYLKKQGKEVYTLQSNDAVRTYNDYVNQKKRVGILLHSTC